MKEGLPPKENKEEKEKINNISQKILNTDFSKIDYTEMIDFLYGVVKENRPVLYDNEIKSLYNKYLIESKNSNSLNRMAFEVGRAIMDYTSDTKIIDNETQESTLDRSYRIFYEIAEINPEEMHDLSEWTHHLFEFVKPEVFFDTYIKIKNSKVLNKNFGGSQFSQLEYNMSYCGTDRYVSALLKEIDFKNSSSCSKSSQFINLAVSLADYAKGGSYSNSYEVDKKIIKGLKSSIGDEDSIYLLDSKTRYIISRLEKDYPPFIYNKDIIKISPRKFALMKNGTLFITKEVPSKELLEKIEKHDYICKQLDTPPKELLDEAVNRGDSSVQWTLDQTKLDMRDKLRNNILSSMEPISVDDQNLWNNKIDESQLNEYINLIGTDYRYFLEKEFKFDLSNFTILEQFYFLEFIQKQTNLSMLKIKDFTKKFEENGFRTFLSIEQGGKEMGNKILELGNPKKLPEDIARKVFAKYGEIIDTADKAEEEVKKLYEKENIPNEVFVSIKETLLNKGAELLSSLADKIDNSEEKIKEEDILKELEDIKTSTIIMGESYIELYKQGIKVPIEDIANTTLEKISSQNLSEENKKELLKVYENGRPKETYENKDHIKLLTEEFEQTLENKDTFVFNIRFNNEIVAFATFYKENEDTLHIGGLTFIDDVRNPAIGNAVMISIMNEFKNFNIKALVHSQNKVLAMYQKRFGFKIVKELPKEENAGELYYEIEKKKVSDSIQMDKDKIKEAA